MSVRIRVHTIHRGERVGDEVQKPRVHVALRNGKASAYAIGTNKASATRNANRLMKLHIHALSRQELLERGAPLTVGIPAGYKLASMEQ